MTEIVLTVDINPTHNAKWAQRTALNNQLAIAQNSAAEIQKEWQKKIDDAIQLAVNNGQFYTVLVDVPGIVLDELLKDYANNSESGRYVIAEKDNFVFLQNRTPAYKKNHYENKVMYAPLSIRDHLSGIAANSSRTIIEFYNACQKNFSSLDDKVTASNIYGGKYYFRYTEEDEVIVIVEAARFAQDHEIPPIMTLDDGQWVIVTYTEYWPVDVATITLKWDKESIDNTYPGINWDNWKEK